MKPLYIALIVIGCLIVVAVAVTVPLVLLLNQNSSSTPTPTTTSTVPEPPTPPIPPIPPVPPTPPTVVYPRYLYTTIIDSDLNTNLYITDSQADPPVTYFAFNMTNSFYNCSISQDQKFLYVPGDYQLKIMNLSSPLSPFVSTTIDYNNYQPTYPDLINSRYAISNLSGTLLFVSFAGRPLGIGSGGGIAVFQLSDYSLLQWVPATGEDKFYVPAGLAMNRNDQVLYVANAIANRENTFTTFTLANNTLTYHATIAGASVTNAGLSGLALSPDSNKLYSNALSSVFITDTNSLTVENTLSLSSTGSMVSLQPAGKFAFVGLYSGAIAAYDISGDPPTFVSNQSAPGTVTFPSCVATNKYLFTFTSTGAFYSRIDVNPIFSNFTLMRSVTGSFPQIPSQSFLVVA